MIEKPVSLSEVLDRLAASEARLATLTAEVEERDELIASNNARAETRLAALTAALAHICPEHRWEIEHCEGCTTLDAGKAG
jgi:hypothetical protein